MLYSGKRKKEKKKEICGKNWSGIWEECFWNSKETWLSNKPKIRGGGQPEADDTKEFSVIHYISKPGINPKHTVWLQAKIKRIITVN